MRRPGLGPVLGIVDYGMGNLHSVAKAVAKSGADTRLIDDPCDLTGIDGVILPGVGNFGEAMNRLVSAGFVDPLRQWLTEGRPFLGICLGMQVLFESSEEAPDRPGLGFFKGTVRRFPFEVEGKKLTVPAIGWNTVRVREDVADVLSPDDATRNGFEPSYYFVHSYFVDPEDDAIVAARAYYGISYAAAVARPPIYATQFHPEKSGDGGLELLRCFVKKMEVAA